MASKCLQWILKLIFVSAILLVFQQVAKWPYLWNSIVLRPLEIHDGHEIMERSVQSKTFDQRNVSNYHGTIIIKAQDGKTLSTNNSDRIVKNIYGSECPLNPYKQTLNYLFNYWMALDNYYNLSSFLCGGSLVGSVRDRDLIPYDRDIDVCVTLKTYQKLRVLRSGKPFDYQSSQIYLAVQEDFLNNNVSSRIRIDCWGRVVQDAKDPCSFKTPGARLISRGVYVDVFVFREHGRYLRDHEYEKDHLKTDIFPLKYCMFMGVKSKCPRDKLSLLLKYYEPDVLNRPHYKCQNKTWVATSENSAKQFKIWFNKKLKLLYS